MWAKWLYHPSRMTLDTCLSHINQMIAKDAEMVTKKGSSKNAVEMETKLHLWHFKFRSTWCIYCVHGGGNPLGHCAGSCIPNFIDIPHFFPW